MRSIRNRYNEKPIDLLPPNPSPGSDDDQVRAAIRAAEAAGAVAAKGDIADGAYLFLLGSGMAGLIMGWYNLVSVVVVEGQMRLDRGGRAAVSSRWVILGHLGHWGADGGEWGPVGMCGTQQSCSGDARLAPGVLRCVKDQPEGGPLCYCMQS